MTRSTARSAPTATPEPLSNDGSRRWLASSLLRSLRPGQWTKNLVIFAAIIFGERLLDSVAMTRVSLAFLAFCALSSSVYLVNDLVDRVSDQQHPLKRARPIASGTVSARLATWSALGLAALALGLAFFLGWPFFATAVAYGVLQLGYTWGLKHVVILDVLTISIGFVLRALAGGAVIDVPISNWLLLCTILLALFLALSKRRQEIVALEEQARRHRPALAEYTVPLLDQMIGIVTTSTLMAYAFYTMSDDTIGKFGDGLILTMPFPLYGVFRYLYLLYRKDGGGDPSELLLTDRPLLTCVALWTVAVALIIYTPLA